MSKLWFLQILKHYSRDKTCGLLGIIDTLTACIDGDHDNTIVCIITLHIHDVSVIQALESQAVLITKVGRTRKCEVGSRQSGELAIVIMGFHNYA